MFAANQTSIDLSSISSLSSLTGGELYHYQNYNDIVNEKLYYDIFRNLTRNYGFDIAFTLRSSLGITTGDYYGGFYTKSTKIIELAAADSDKTFGVAIKPEGKLTPESDLYT